MKRSVIRSATAAALTVTASVACIGMAPHARAATTDPFFTYSGSTPLASYKPGAVLKTRTLPYHVVGIPTPVQAVQILYRTIDAQGRPAANVTSILKPVGGGDPSKAVSFQSYYDSGNPEDGPSRAIAGDVRLGSALFDTETLLIVPLLTQGYSVIVADTEGQQADFLASPEYGTNTLDSIRATTHEPATGLNTSTRIGMIGYSGGSVASTWAAQLAPKYAPDVNKQLVGAAVGGVVVDPAHMTEYASGSLLWAGVMPTMMATTARAYGEDLSPYLSDYGKQVMPALSHEAMVNVLGRYPGLKWQQLFKPEYSTLASIPPLARSLNKINMGSAPTPTIPMFLGQGANGALEGTLTNNLPGIGPGDGITVTGDVRALARQFCADGNNGISYSQYDLLSHNTAEPVWAPQAILWLNARFAGKTAPSSCGHIPPGNSLAPLPTS
ncbi:MAG TPA: lipase family protein [Flexivirga sp.]|uniref:lipase family protein n=1 Tax=Flexivirga sp. TaxID=1962927 RepID=UPI002C0A9A9C|nr:lipase family protein [Flexivirga sp.]HWC22864.1 lipase family protein [Flexivirga sp.]